MVGGIWGMKIGILTVAYREEYFIADCVNQFKGRGFQHLVLVSDTPWHGEREPMDETVELAERVGAKVIVSDWSTEAEQRNYGLKELRENDWVLIVDADEEYEKGSVDSLLTFLETANLPAYGIGKIATYWKTKEYRIDPPESGGLIVAVKPTVQFYDKRCVSSEWDFLPEDIVMHHYSYVRDDLGMRRKIATFEHANEIVPNWYEEVWCKWTPESQNLHPVHPESFARAIYVGQES
jgi:glycosyltransferase involved in cell wall biosynthesis